VAVVSGCIDSANNRNPYALRHRTVFYVGRNKPNNTISSETARVTNRLCLYTKRKHTNWGPRRLDQQCPLCPLQFPNFRRSAFVDLKNMEIKSRRNSYTQLLPLGVSLFDKRVSRKLGTHFPSPKKVLNPRILHRTFVQSPLPAY